jgi:transcriptional regulator with XRE-family HTH domain
MSATGTALAAAAHQASVFRHETGFAHDGGMRCAAGAPGGGGRRDAEAERLAEIDRQVGEAVRLFRTLRRMTADSLAARVGVTMQQISKYESGTNRLSAGMLYLIARELRVPVSTFFEDGTELDGSLRALLTRRDAAPSEAVQREAVQLAANFARIASPGLRHHVAAMLRLIADREGTQPRDGADPGETDPEA